MIDAQWPRRLRGALSAPLARQILGVALAGLLLVFAGAAAVAGERQPAGAGEEAVLTILHTADWHGYPFAEPHDGGEPSGGVVAVAGLVNAMRAERPGSVLVLDGGDLLAGHPAASLVDDGLTGAHFVRFWDRIGYDAFAIGNHELDHGMENLRGLLGLMETPGLCANLLRASAEGPGSDADLPLPAARYRVFERAGVRVAVVGLITRGLEGLVPASALEGTRVLDPVDALRALWPELQRVSDVQIAVTHMGIGGDIHLARAFPDLAAVMGGHSHTRRAEPVMVGDVPVIHPGARGREVARLDLTIRDRRVVASEGRLIRPLRADALDRVPPALLEAEEALRAKIRELKDEVVGEVGRDLTRRYDDDSFLGGAVADALRRAADAEVGMINSGGLRADLPAGPVTRAQLLTAFPFGNEVVRFEVTGAELEALLTYNLEMGLQRRHGILQLAGVQVRYRVRDDAVEVDSIRVGGAPLERDRVYRCATNSFVAIDQAEKYLDMELRRPEPLGLRVVDAVEAALREDGLPHPPHRRQIRLRQNAGEPAPPPEERQGSARPRHRAGAAFAAADLAPSGAGRR